MSCWTIICLKRKWIFQDLYCVKNPSESTFPFFCYCLSKLTFLKKYFRNTIRMSNSLDLSVLIRVQTVSNGYQQTTKVDTSQERVKLNGQKKKQMAYQCNSAWHRLGITRKNETNSYLSAEQAKPSAHFVLYVRKERSRLSAFGLRRCGNP